MPKWQHVKTRVTSDHQLAILAKPQQQKVNIMEEDLSRGCLLHAEEIIEYYCETCRAFCCVTCTMINHNDHVLLKLEEKGSRSLRLVTALLAAIFAIQYNRCCPNTLPHMNVLQNNYWFSSDTKKLKQGIERRMQFFNDEVQKIKRMEKALEESKTGVTDDLLSAINTIRAMLDAEERRIIDTSNNYFNAKLETLTEKRHQFKNIIKEANNLLSICEKSEAETDDVSIIGNLLDIEEDAVKLETVLGVDEAEFHTLAFRMENNVRLGALEELHRKVYVKDHAVAGQRISNSVTSSVSLDGIDELRILTKFKTQNYIQEPTGRISCLFNLKSH